MKDDASEQPQIGPAWKAAADFGIDMSLLEANLRRTVPERLRVLGRAVNAAASLARGVKEKHERS